MKLEQTSLFGEPEPIKVPTVRQESQLVRNLRRRVEELQLQVDRLESERRRNEESADRFYEADHILGQLAKVLRTYDHG